MGFQPTPVNWKRPDIPKDILRQCTRRSDKQGWFHALGTLAILTVSGTFSFLMFHLHAWVWMGVGLYVHGALWAFRPQIHEFSHRNVFQTRWLNTFWSYVYGCLHWNVMNPALYRLSHRYHHLYTLHSKSEGEKVHPRAETSESLLWALVRVVDLTGLIKDVYERIYLLFVPFLDNVHNSEWLRYVYRHASKAERREVFVHYWVQLGFHIVVAALAIAGGAWFVIVLVTFPRFYGGKWYERMVHETMHVGCQPESDDFRLCCRSVKLDPFTSFMYWHMEYHAEHHAFAAVPCYNLKKFHQLTKEHWNEPQTLWQAWHEMNEHSYRLLNFNRAVSAGQSDHV